MTNEEFDRAIDAIRQGQISRQPSRAEAVEEAQCASWVLAAMCLVMRELRNIPEEQTWEPTSAQIVAFIDGLDEGRRRILRRIASEVEEDKDPH
jgi:hypothetical protein